MLGRKCVGAFGVQNDRVNVFGLGTESESESN